MEARPNPASDRLNVNALFEVGWEVEVGLLDITGRSILDMDLFQIAVGLEYKRSFDVSTSNAGIYVLNVRVNADIQTMQIMITR